MRTKSVIRGEAEALATFDYFKAIWKNGPGAASDAPAWVLAEIERELSLWIEAHSRELVGVHHCEQSGLVLGILASPSAFGGDGSLDESSHGSFLHVFATDHPDRRSLDVGGARALFESTYGAPISDGAIRQQRNFMLLDFPYHEDLAKDLFIDKDRVEGVLERGASEETSEIDETPVLPNLPPTPPMPPPANLESRPALHGSLSSLLEHRDQDTPSRGKAGLPFEQDQSYAEVIAGLRERLYGSASPAPREHSPDDPVPSPIRTSTDAQAPVADVVTAADVGPAAEALTAADVGPAADVVTAEADRPAEKFDLPIDEPLQGLGRIKEARPRRAWSPVYPLAALVVAVLLLAGVVVPRFLEPATVQPTFEDAKAPAVLTPDGPTRSALSELIGPDGHSNAELVTEIDALAVDAPELQPTALAPVVVPISPVLARQEVKPDSLNIAAARLPSIEILEADSLAASEASLLTVTRTEPAPATVVSVTTNENDVDPSFDAVLATLMETAELEQSSEALGESEATDSTKEPGADSATTEVGVTATTIVREAKPRVGRTGRERKRVIGQINRYR
jgi:hypothetical protein